MATEPRGTRGAVAVLLLTAGALTLFGRLFPVAHVATVLVLGLELLGWAVVARHPGPLLAGSVTTGIGVGVLAAFGPPAGAEERVLGGGFVLAVSAGFALLASVSRAVTGDGARWAWIPAGALAALGTGLLVATPDAVLGALGWVAPAVLLAMGALALLRSGRDV